MEGIIIDGSPREGGGQIKADGVIYGFSRSDAPGVKADWIGQRVNFEPHSPSNLTAIDVRLCKPNTRVGE
jgi:hypothetical protein